MQWYYSPSTKGFYNNSDHVVRPDDAMEITAETRAILLAGEAAGQTISADSNGFPILISADDRSKICALIKTIRNHRTEQGGVQVDGRWYDTDSTSALRYKYLADLALSAGAVNETVIRADWRPMDYDTLGPVDMTYGLLLRIMRAGIEQALAIDTAAEVHRAALLAADDPAAYDYRGGWPLAFFDPRA